MKTRPARGGVPSRGQPGISRLALRPCLGTLTADESAALLADVEEVGLTEFFAFLYANRLDQLWRQYLASLARPSPGPATQLQREAFAPYVDALDKQALQLAAQNLKEEIHLRAIHRLLGAAEIPYFIFKGADLRYTLYPLPTLRSSCDIDLFVPQAQKDGAVGVLVGDGFELHVNPQNISHEVSLYKDGVHIDLHWQLMRPGRTRIDLSDYLFANRETFSEGFQGLNHRASLLVMLIHPAFTKHLASPSSMLIHMVDLHRLLGGAAAEPGAGAWDTEASGPEAWSPGAWTDLIEILEQSGTRTAAWSSLRLLAHYSGLDGEDRDGGDRAGSARAAAAGLATQLQPGSFHRRYLQYWIDHDLVRRWFHNRFVIRTFFSLALQDSLTDAVRAVVRKATFTSTR